MQSSVYTNPYAPSRLLGIRDETSDARVNNTVNLYSYLEFCGNIMFTLGPNNNLWLTEATGMDKNGCDMLNDSKFAFFLDNWGCRGSAWGQNQELEIL